MLIDWFTVSAQVVNFLVLVWLLKRFLYKPILGAIDKREKRIAAQLAEAEEEKAEAQKERDEFFRRNDELEGQRLALLRKAEEEAEARRLQLLEEARQESDSLRRRRLENLRNEQLSLSREIIRRTRQEVFAIARKALAELAGADLEARMAEVFIHRLRNLSGSEKDRLASAFKGATLPALVRSTYDLPREKRAAIESAVGEWFAGPVRIRFETAPDQVSGIELAVNGNKVAWSIADYLSSLEKSVAELLEKKAGPGLQAGVDEHGD